MIKVSIKYYGKPMKVDKENHKIITHTKNYTIDEYIKAEEFYDTPEETIRKEVTKMFKKYKGLYSIKFSVHD